MATFTHYKRDPDTGEREAIKDPEDSSKNKKFKFKQLPERPKASAPETRWKAYEKALDAVLKINASIKQKDKVKESIIDRTSKRIENARAKKK